MNLVSPIPLRRSRMSSARLGLLIAGLVLISLVLLGRPGIDWFLLKQSLRHRFPSVEWITTSTLADWLADRERQPPVLLDVRTDREWDVSHLPGSRRVDPNASVQEATVGLPKGTPIVTYCAVGYRSGAFAAKLRAAGFTAVRNLDGSIFQWANEHRPLVREEKPVTTVHPYNRLWGRLLRDDVRAPLPKS